MSSCKIKLFNGDYKATADIEGYIQSITPETKGEDQAETGRLRVTILTNDSIYPNQLFSQPIQFLLLPQKMHPLEVSLTCSFATNDYVNKEEKLIEALKCNVAFINDVNGDYKATADIEGYIQDLTAFAHSRVGVYALFSFFLPSFTRYS